MLMVYLQRRRRRRTTDDAIGKGKHKMSKHTCARLRMRWMRMNEQNGQNEEEGKQKNYWKSLSKPIVTVIQAVVCALNALCKCVSVHRVASCWFHARYHSSPQVISNSVCAHCRTENWTASIAPYSVHSHMCERAYTHTPDVQLPYDDDIDDDIVRRGNIISDQIVSQVGLKNIYHVINICEENIIIMPNMNMLVCVLESVCVCASDDAYQMRMPD